jgi:hypothetical protein
MCFWAGLDATEAREAINYGVDLMAKTTEKLMGGAKVGKSTLLLIDSAQDGADDGRPGN